MEMKKNSISIVGCGPGSPEYLTPAACRVIEEADVIVGAKRLLELFPTPDAKRLVVEKDTESLLKEIAAHRDSHIAVLVTGDPGLYSLASLVIKRFGRDACRVIPGISSVQTAFARLGLPWEDVKIISAHASQPELNGEELCACGKIAILAGNEKFSRPLTQLADFMETKGYRIFICEDLTLPEEHFFEIDAAGIKGFSFSTRTIILIVRKDLL